MARFSTTNLVWKTMDAPVDRLVAHGGENNEWVSSPKTWSLAGVLATNVCCRRMLGG